MKVTVLCDNNTYIDNYLLGEPALCFYIENEKDKILVDLGYSDVYKQNAEKLGVDLNQVNILAFSHGHDDHTRGLKFLPKSVNPKIYYASTCFDEKLDNGRNVSAPYTLEELSKKYQLEEVNEPKEISQNLYFLGNIPRVCGFEKPTDAIGDMKDDTALVYVADDGLVVITGCSHSGICNICEFAKNTFKKTVKLVIGGFHLLELDDKAKKTICYFKKYKNIKLYPCHCTSLHVKSEMIKKGLDVTEVGVGLELNL